jgi:selenocysteine-specific elongation factor
MLAGLPTGPDPAGEVLRRGIVRRAELAAMGGGAPAEGDDVLGVGDWLMDRGRAGELATRLLASVLDHDRQVPLDPGLPVGAARRELELPEGRLVEILLTVDPAAARLIVRDGRVYRADAVHDGLPAVLREALDTIRTELADNPFAAPEASRLTELGLGGKELAALVRANELTRIADGIYLLPGAEHAAVRVLAGLGDREFTLSEARQALRTSRRVAVPLLQRLARVGHTRRTPDGNHHLVPTHGAANPRGST